MADKKCADVRCNAQPPYLNRDLEDQIIDLLIKRFNPERGSTTSKPILYADAVEFAIDLIELLETFCSKHEKEATTLFRELALAYQCRLLQLCREPTVELLTETQAAVELDIERKLLSYPFSKT